MEDYEKLWQIGAGGQGKVLRVRKKKTTKEYALKQIVCRDSHEMNFALHEIKVLTNVKHDHIIGFHDFFIHKDRYSQISICLVMELCECGDFSDRIKDAKRRKLKFEEERIRKWLCQMCAALHYLHEQDYIHRDVKPTNIFFTSDDNVRLGDFGLSRRCEEAGRKTVVGTPYYFAPELMLRQRYTNKVDLWGVGVVVLELCTLRERPINTQLLQGNANQVLSAVESEIEARGYSSRLAQMCRSMLAKDPCNRPSAKDILSMWAPQGERAKYGLCPRPRSKSGGPGMAGEQAREEKDQLLKQLAARDDEVKKLKSELQRLKTEHQHQQQQQQVLPKKEAVPVKRAPGRAPLQPVCLNARAARGKKNEDLRKQRFVPIADCELSADDAEESGGTVVGSSIQKAIDAASVGDVLLIEPGVYTEQLTISKAITLRAKDKENRPVIEVQGRTAVTLSADAELDSLVIKQQRAAAEGGDGKWVAVDIRQGSPLIVNSDLSSCGGACITVHGVAEPTVRGCCIHDGAQSGIYFFDGAKGVVESCSIHNNTYAAVLMKRGAEPIIRNNKIFDGRDTGIFICHDSKGTVQGNQIYNNGGSGVVVKAGGAPTLLGNSIRNNQQAGIFVCDKGGGVYRENDISGNVKAGVLIKTHANPMVTKNNITGGKETGVYCFEHGGGVLRENVIANNQNAGVLVTSSGRLTIQANTITGNKYEGVWICNGGEAVVTGNDLSGNAKGAMDIDEACRANVVTRDNILS